MHRARLVCVRLVCSWHVVVLEGLHAAGCVSRACLRACVWRSPCAPDLAEASVCAGRKAWGREARARRAMAAQPSSKPAGRQMGLMEAPRVDQVHDDAVAFPENKVKHSNLNPNAPGKWCVTPAYRLARVARARSGAHAEPHKPRSRATGTSPQGKT